MGRNRLRSSNAYMYTHCPDRYVIGAGICECGSLSTLMSVPRNGTRVCEPTHMPLCRIRAPLAIDCKRIEKAGMLLSSSAAEQVLDGALNAATTAPERLDVALELVEAHVVQLS